jgi:vancomycin resistance protein VanW
MILQENKRQNLALALDKLHLILIKPGETFSIWKNVGRPTRSKGYLEGLILHQGKVERGIGGGLCQLGNLLFWMIAHSPLEITERHRHSFDVFPDVNRKIPFGAGATLSYNYIDFQFTNTTPYLFQLELWLDDTHLNGRLVCDCSLKESYQLEERHHRFEQQIWGGYTRHNQLFKITKDATGFCHEELFVENHALMMYTPFLADRSAST